MIIYEADSKFFPTLEQAEQAEKSAYYIYYPVKEHETGWSWEEWEARFNLARENGADILGAADFAFGDLVLDESPLQGTL